MSAVSTGFSLGRLRDRGWVSEKAGSLLPKGVVGHAVGAEKGQEFGLHAARY